MAPRRQQKHLGDVYSYYEVVDGLPCARRWWKQQRESTSKGTYFRRQHELLSVYNIQSYSRNAYCWCSLRTIHVEPTNGAMHMLPSKIEAIWCTLQGMYDTCTSSAYEWSHSYATLGLRGGIAVTMIEMNWLLLHRNYFYQYFGQEAWPLSPRRNAQKNTQQYRKYFSRCRCVRRAMTVMSTLRRVAQCVRIPRMPVMELR